MRKIFCFILVLILVFIFTFSVNATNDNDIVNDVLISAIDQTIDSDIERLDGDLIAILLACDLHKENLSNAKESILTFSGIDAHKSVKLVRWLDNKYKWLDSYKDKIINESEYPEATKIWYLLKTYGYSDTVCAAILGNIMAEVGGQTLNLQPLLYVDGFYGMCMWSIYYYPEAYGLDLDKQCEFLRDTIQKEINYAGFCYYSGFGYDDFLEMTNHKDAALAFAMCYERCSSASYGIRQINADIAYNYFVTKIE